MSVRCPMCGGSGWCLDCRPSQSPVMLELIPCIYPTCENSGRDVEHISLSHDLALTRPVVGPDGVVMAVGR